MTFGSYLIKVNKCVFTATDHFYSSPVRFKNFLCRHLAFYNRVCPSTYPFKKDAFFPPFLAADDTSPVKIVTEDGTFRKQWPRDVILFEKVLNGVLKNFHPGERFEKDVNKTGNGQWEIEN